MTDLRILLPLLSAHLLSEFRLRPASAAFQTLQPRALIQHAALVALLGYLLTGAWTLWPLPLGIFLAHLVLDPLSARLTSINPRTFLLHHLLHLVILVALLSLLHVVPLPPSPPLLWYRWWGNGYFRALILLSGFLVTVDLGAVLIGFGVEPYLRQLRRQAEVRFLGTQGLPETMKRGFESGGRTIGQLERALILLFVLVHQPAGVGFLIAAKSVFRFGELSDRSKRMEAEYILIGTLMSTLYGLVVAYATRWALSAL